MSGYVLAIRARGLLNGKPLDKSFELSYDNREEADKVAKAFRTKIRGRPYQYTVRLRKDNASAH